MIRTLIIDDEYLIRQAICRLINWTGLGFQIVAEASDGLEAMELVEKYVPDLMILDINIPLLDGIQVAEKVRASYPQVKIIILTGYDTFDYIQRCMRAGVMNYVVKPLEKDEFQEAVIAAKREILKERNLEKFSEYFNLSDESDFCLKANSFFNEPQKNQSDFIELFIGNMQNKEYARYFVAILEVDFLRKKFRTQKKRILTLMSASMLVKEYLEREGLSHAVHPYNNNVLIGICLPESHTLLNVKSCFERSAQHVLENLNISISCGISISFSEANEVEDAIIQAQKALEYKFCEGTGKVYDYDSTHISYPDKSNSTFDTSEITSLLRQGEYGRVYEQLHVILSDAAKNNLCKDYFFLIATSLVNCIVHFSVELGLNTKEIFHNRSVYVSYIEKFETAAELENWLDSLYKNVISFTTNSCLKRSDSITARTCKYIEQNYQCYDLSVTYIANRLFITSNHLCKVFKREMKTTLTKYIVSFRMNKAKRLIDENKEQQIISLSKAVGYSDPFYFSKTFKKFFGVSPSKYINMQNS